LMMVFLHLLVFGLKSTLNQNSKNDQFRGLDKLIKSNSLKFLF
jgi:hypothetical protein